MLVGQLAKTHHRGHRLMMSVRIGSWCIGHPSHRARTRNCLWLQGVRDLPLGAPLRPTATAYRSTSCVPPARFGFDPGGGFGLGRNPSTGNSLSVPMKNLSPAMSNNAPVGSAYRPMEVAVVEVVPWRRPALPRWVVILADQRG